jgi:SAM-dependent methyltransferase
MTPIPTACRACRHEELSLLLSLGKTPLANAFLNPDQLGRPEPHYPLDLAICPRCSLVQLGETVPPDQLFTEYLYFSSFSETMLHHVRDLANRLVRTRGLGRDSLVVEVGSNDGYLLQCYQEEGIPVLGIEPAANVARVAEERRGIRTLPRFFDAELARGLKDQGTQADLVHAHNVLAHVHDLNGFVEGIHLLLRDGGVAVIEVPYVKDLVERCEFDTIYHEHLSYFSLTVLEQLFHRHGLFVKDVEKVPVHGGSLRLVVAKEGSGRPGPAVEALLAEEAASGLNRPAFYHEFGRRVARLKQVLCGLVAGLKAGGKRIAAYGAAAKSTTLLHHFGLGRETLDFIVDRSSAKQGRYSPGTHLPVLPPRVLLEAMPDYVLLLTWNWQEEILAQQQEYRRRGGRFIIPLPQPAVV